MNIKSALPDFLTHLNASFFGEPRIYPAICLAALMRTTEAVKQLNGLVLAAQEDQDLLQDIKRRSSLNQTI